MDEIQQETAAPARRSRRVTSESVADQAARKLLETCKFKPGMVNGKLEKSSATLEVVWKLD